MSLKISIITAVLNRRDTLSSCIESVMGQDYPDVEHILIDGGSTDGTLEVIRSYQDKISRWISEPDSGLYDAMNKGIRLATGDVIGILNSDDYYTDRSALSTVAECLKKKVDSCYGDIDYVDDCSDGNPVRAWHAGEYHRNRFKWGWMPPHPTFFARRALYEKYGLFNLDFKLAADYELMLRFLYKHHVSATYIPKCLVTMRTGGACKPGIANTLSNMGENYRAWKVNALRPNPLTFVLKPLSKIGQYARFRSVRSKE
ncbi:MAG TPA: glycosyltransferase family 2 protein [Smithella sp.]|nr:glycosyltransferase family 2 protein [Smithella sp.]